MEDLVKTLQKRDGISKKEAEDEKSEIQSTIWDMLGNGDGYDEIEEMMMDDYGLEMDYIMDMF